MHPAFKSWIWNYLRISLIQTQPCFEKTCIPCAEELTSGVAAISENSQKSTSHQWLEYCCQSEIDSSLFIPFMCVCLCVRGKTIWGCSCSYLEALTGLTLRFHGWLGLAFVCMCAPQQRRERCSGRLRKRDTWGLFSDSFLPWCSHLHQWDTEGQTQRQLYTICWHTHASTDTQEQRQICTRARTLWKKN